VADQLDDLHANVALSLLAASGALGSKVFDGKVDDPMPNPPFVVVYTLVEWPSGPDEMANAIDHLSATCRTTWYIHCVGSTAAAARRTAMHVRSTLIDVTPVIAGRSCGMISQVDVQPPVRDETTGRLVMDLVHVYTLLTAPG
jgi:hypothetical protein